MKRHYSGPRSSSAQGKDGPACQPEWVRRRVNELPSSWIALPVSGWCEPRRHQVNYGCSLSRQTQTRMEWEDLLYSVTVYAFPGNSEPRPFMMLPVAALAFDPVSSV
eukprot:1317602-Rhodomonas_salina.2